jgi:hypothetical protein
MNSMITLSVVRSTLTASVASVIGLASILGASPSQAAVINGNFDNDLTGWGAKGSANIVDGKAFLSAFGDSDTNIETFLGLGAGALDALNGSNATNGSAIKQTITVNAGDILSFDWQFQGQDYLPYNDFSFFSISSLASKLADIKAVGSFGQKLSQTSYTFQSAGTYTIGFGVFNALDTAASSTLAIDNVKLSSTTSVPEPASIVGILAIGATGTTSALKRKQLVKARQNV